MTVDVLYLMMPELKVFHAIVVTFVGAVALYLGIVNPVMYGRGPFRTIPLPRSISRVIYFAVAGIAIYILVCDLR
jgi:hypothetical protein